MIATTSVPAIWALTGMTIAMTTIAAYFLIFFMLLFVGFWGIAYFIRALKRMLRPGWYD